MKSKVWHFDVSKIVWPSVLNASTGREPRRRSAALPGTQAARSHQDARELEGECGSVDEEKRTHSGLDQ